MTIETIRIPHDGGENPVREGETLVKVWFRGGWDQTENMGHGWVWSHTGGTWDIIAYAVTPERAPSPPAKAPTMDAVDAVKAALLPYFRTCEGPEVLDAHLTVLAQAALSAARPFIAAEWQPIETAPKDGSRLLAGRFAAGCKHDGLIVVDSYATPQQMRGWTGFGKFNEYHWPATHWQPLPAPPTAIKETIR